MEVLFEHSYVPVTDNQLLLAYQMPERKFNRLASELVEAARDAASRASQTPRC